MTYRVIVSAGARRDLRQLRKYIRQASSKAIAMRFVEDLLAFCATLQMFPHRGTVRDDAYPGLRVIGFRGRLSIHFTVEQDAVTILTFAYAGRNWSDDYAAE